jgi:hypothetical protein
MTDADRDDDGVSEETMMLVARVRHRAGEAPSISQITALALDAVGNRGGDLSEGEIRQLAATALGKAQHITFLLGKLAAMIPDQAEGEAHGQP